MNELKEFLLQMIYELEIRSTEHKRTRELYNRNMSSSLYNHFDGRLDEDNHIIDMLKEKLESLETEG